MQLYSLLKALPSAIPPTCLPPMEIGHLTDDSRTATPNSLFVAIRGRDADGHAYLPAAYRNGCRAFVLEYPVMLPPDAVTVYVPDARLALAHLAAAFYGHPANGLLLIGITGTKGKTTTAMMLYRLLCTAGLPCGYIGSGGVRYAQTEEKSENTTPSALHLHRIFADMRRAHMRAAVVEVSSQALTHGRVAGLSFPFCIFTNLAADHIGVGEHPDMTHYRKAKAGLFSDYGCHTAILNADDENAAAMLEGSSATAVHTVSCQDRRADLYAARIRPVTREDAFATAFSLYSKKEGEIPVTLPLPGVCNVYNAMLALCAADLCLSSLSPPKEAHWRSLASHLADWHIPGRFQVVQTPQPGVRYVIDYAHNGYSLRAAIAALRAYAPARLVCLFGSVGARTYSRRTELGEAACAADFCIVTADDPGSEAPADTMREICRVLSSCGREYVAIPDREEAIRYAVRHARPGDLVLLAGKGHETHQLIGTARIPFCEETILRAAVADQMAASVL